MTHHHTSNPDPELRGRSIMLHAASVDRDPTIDPRAGDVWEFKAGPRVVIMPPGEHSPWAWETRTCDAECTRKVYDSTLQLRASLMAASFVGTLVPESPIRSFDPSQAIVTVAGRQCVPGSDAPFEIKPVDGLRPYPAELDTLAAELRAEPRWFDRHLRDTLEIEPMRRISIEAREGSRAALEVDKYGSLRVVVYDIDGMAEYIAKTLARDPKALAILGRKPEEGLRGAYPDGSHVSPPVPDNEALRAMLCRALGVNPNVDLQAEAERLSAARMQFNSAASVTLSTADAIHCLAGKIDDGVETLRATRQDCARLEDALRATEEYKRVRDQLRAERDQLRSKAALFDQVAMIASGQPGKPGADDAVLMWARRAGAEHKQLVHMLTISGTSHETQTSVAAWADKTFGPCAPLRAAHRAVEEMQEFIGALSTEIYDHDSNLIPSLAAAMARGHDISAEGRLRLMKEGADIIVTLWRFYSTLQADAQTEVDRVMAINHKREWTADGTGCGYHVKRLAQSQDRVDVSPVVAELLSKLERYKTTVEMEDGSGETKRVAAVVRAAIPVNATLTWTSSSSHSIVAHRRPRILVLGGDDAPAAASRIADAISRDAANPYLVRSYSGSAAQVAMDLRRVWSAHPQDAAHLCILLDGDPELVERAANDIGAAVVVVGPPVAAVLGKASVIAGFDLVLSTRGVGVEVVRSRDGGAPWVTAVLEAAMPGQRARLGPQEYAQHVTGAAAAHGEADRVVDAHPAIHCRGAAGCVLMEGGELVLKIDPQDGDDCPEVNIRDALLWLGAHRALSPHHTGTVKAPAIRTTPGNAIVFMVDASDGDPMARLRFGDQRQFEVDLLDLEAWAQAHRPDFTERT